MSFYTYLTKNLWINGYLQTLSCIPCLGIVWAQKTCLKPSDLREKVFAITNLSWDLGPPYKPYITDN